MGFACEVGVNLGGLGGRVAEELSDLGERDAALQQPRRERVAQVVQASVADTGTVERRFEHTPVEVRFPQRTPGWRPEDERRPARHPGGRVRASASAAEILTRSDTGVTFDLEPFRQSCRDRHRPGFP